MHPLVPMHPPVRQNFVSGAWTYYHVQFFIFIVVVFSILFTWFYIRSFCIYLLLLVVFVFVLFLFLDSTWNSIASLLCSSFSQADHPDAATPGIDLFSSDELVLMSQTCFVPGEVRTATAACPPFAPTLASRGWLASILPTVSSSLRVYLCHRPLAPNME